MTIVSSFAVLMLVVTILSLLNNRFIRKPTMIVLTGFSVLLFGALRLMHYAGFPILETRAVHILKTINPSATILDGFLCFMLFAGALHINIEELLDKKVIIALLSTLGVILSALVVGSLIYITALIFSLSIPLVYCFIFGALIAPTDAVAVLSLLRDTSIPRDLEVKFVGESLFNDGVSIVLFSTLVTFIANAPSFEILLMLPIKFTWSVVSGCLIGFICGYAAHYIIPLAKDTTLEIKSTVTLVLCTYALSHSVGASGPISVVIAGLIIGNSGLRSRFNEATRVNIMNFWKIVDETLNSFLFVFIGLHIVLLTATKKVFLFATISIPIVLIGRYVSVKTLLKIPFKGISLFPEKTSLLLTWGGLRGGISIALVLSLPESAARDVFLLATYLVVISSIFVNGLTLPLVLKKFGFAR